MNDDGSMSPDTAITEPIGPSRSWGPIKIDRSKLRRMINHWKHPL